MRARRVLAGAGAAVLAVLLAQGARRAWPALAPAAPPADAAAVALPPLPPVATGAAAALPSAPHAFSADDRAFLALLRDKFGARIAGDRHAQIRLLEQLMAYLAAHYPGAGPELIAAFLRELFPELAETLYGQFLRLSGYNDWLRASRDTLRALSPADRRAALWRARRELFGAQADEIWAAELRNATIQDALRQLDTTEGLGTGEKLALYLDAVTQAYGEDAPRFVETRQTELMYRFLDAGSVQRDLQAMAPMERGAALREIRAGLGMGQEALDRWDALDHERDRAWELGLQYMEARAGILARPADGARDAELAALQDRTFGAEAEVIRSEEAAGFFRYGGARRFGRE